MLRNKEIRRMLIVMLLLTAIGGSITYLIHPLAGLLTILLASLLLITAIHFTYRRYHEIDRLSKYLRRIYSGDYTFDIRDNREGELSILKNEIYKVTVILSKQAELLQWEKEQLARALSDISHQLKTPLTSMTVMTDLLSDPALPQEKRIEFIRNLELQLERMEWLLTSLLKLSKIDAGTVEFKKEPVKVEALIRQALKPLLIPMELKEQTLVISGDETVAFLGDLNWSAEAVINIIKNCVEHTRKGGTITINYEENPIYTEIVISDNGIGITKEDLPYVFKRFYKGKNGNEESVGIGLAMAQSIIANQNGDINVSSEINQGTTFRIKFYKQVS